MSKKIKVIIAILLACAIACGAFIYMHRTKERFVVKTLSLKDIGIDIDTTKYAIQIQLYEDRLLINFGNIFYHEGEPQQLMYLYNSTTKQTTNLTSIFNVSTDFAELDKQNKNVIIWIEEKPEDFPIEYGSNSLPDRYLCGYDLATNTKFVIYAGEGNRRPMTGTHHIFGDWVTWRSGESDDGGLQWTNIKTHLYNLKTGETIYIPEGYCIGIYENDAICKTGPLVYRYNITTGKISEIIEDPALKNSSVFFSDSRIIYNINSTLYCYDLSTEKKEMITDNYSQMPPVLEGDKLFLVDHIEADNTIKDTLYLYNLTTKENTKIWEKTREKPEGLSDVHFIGPRDAYDNIFVWMGSAFDPDKRLLYWTDLYYVEL